MRRKRISSPPDGLCIFRELNISFKSPSVIPGAYGKLIFWDRELVLKELHREA